MWWLTAVKAILGKPFNLYGIQGTTNPASPVLIVNGPIARDCWRRRNGRSSWRAGASSTPRPARRRSRWPSF